MKNTLLILVSSFFLITSSPILAQNKLWYKQPAQNWLEALPLGNGRLGAMVHGGVEQEHIQFNEETLWTGKPRNYAREGASQYLDEIRQLLFDGKQREAQELIGEKFMSVPRSLMAYQPFGDVIIDFPGHKEYTDYYRVLNIENAISKISYNIDGINYTREYFVSHPDQLIAIKLTSDKSGTLDFNVHLESIHFKSSVQTNGDQQRLNVRPDSEHQRFTNEFEESLLYGEAGLKVITDGKVIGKYKEIQVIGATTATIYLAAHTNFINYQDISGKPKSDINKALKKFAALDYDQTKQDHIKDYQALFNRFKIKFDGENKNDLPTNERIYAFWKAPNDPEFVSQYVQFGRYLMISSSRSGTQPANLQGIWNQNINPAWKSKYTTNINAEMNYWPAEVTNLSECHEPFINMINECAQTGEKVAREHYKANGWVLHHNSDIWRATAPINLPFIGPWVGGSGWVTHHLWERFLFTQDEDFLRKEYPVIKKAARFYSEFLVKDPKTGWLISTPSNSPEIGGLVAGPTMDHQIIRSLFKVCIEASEILNTDQEFASKLKQLIPKIAPNQIGRHGQLQEWLEDKDDPEEHHRHVSHLWAVHPGKDINWEETPEMMKAAQQSLEYRGDNGTGWSLAWKINFWARFRDGNRAYRLIHNLLSPAEEPLKKTGGGSYPNLFDAHPPFQIDGNFGGASGIVEMLIQSHLEAIDLLPALPDALDDGHISGVVARGGFELSFDWKKGELQKVSVLSKAGKKCKLRYENKSIEFNTTKGKTYTFNGKLKKIYE